MDIKSLSGRFCQDCGRFYVEDGECPFCSSVQQVESSEEISFSVNMSVLVCDTCQQVMSIGAEACPQCGEEISPDQYTDPMKAPINRAKYRVLGDMFGRLVSAAAVSEPSSVNHPVLTDDQFVEFINRNDVMSDGLIREIQNSLSDLDLSTISRIRSTSTRRAMEGLVAGAEAIRHVYDDIASVALSEQLADLHLLLLSVYKGVLDLRLACGSAIMSVTLEQGQQAQQSMQECLDRLAVSARLMLDSIAEVDIEAAALNQLNRRIKAFVGRERGYDFRGRPDLAAALSSAIGLHKDYRRLAELGTSYFGRLISSDPALLPPEHAVALFLLAAENSAQDDPLTTLRTASVLLGLYNDAFHQDAVRMIDFFGSYESDAEAAAVQFLSLGDRLSTRREEALPIDAFRQELSSAYTTLTEWVYRRLISLPLAARAIIQGHSATYEDYADDDLGAKINELSQASDPRYAPVLLGISTVARNAGAHGDVDTSGAKILLTSRDRMRRVKTEELTDEEFIERMKGLTLTCRALLLAGALFRIERFTVLAPPQPVLSRRVAVETVKAIVGMFDLVRAEVSVDSLENVLVEADEDEMKLGREPRGYLVGAFTLATLFPRATTLSLVVRRDSARTFRINVPVTEAKAYGSVPDHARPYAVLKLCYLSEIEGEDTSEPSRILRELVRPGARLILRELAGFGDSGNGAQDSHELRQSNIVPLIEQAEFFIAVVQSLPKERNADGPRAGLLSGLDAINRGLRLQHELVSSGKWRDADRKNRHLVRGERILERWAAEAS